MTERERQANRLVQKEPPPAEPGPDSPAGWSHENRIGHEHRAEGASETPPGTDTEHVYEGEGAEARQSRWEDPQHRPRLKKVLEGLVFASDRIITQQQLARIVDARLADVRSALTEVIEDYQDRGIQLVEVAGGYQFRTAPDTSEFVRALVAQKPARLSRAQLETLALVAYRQPITRPEIDDVRGVDTGSALKVLLERGLIKMLGRKDEAGRPLLYGTAPYFLEFFGLRNLKDLPTLKEFTELSDDSRTLFKRKMGETVEQAAAGMAGGEAEREASAEPDVDVGHDRGEAKLRVDTGVDGREPTPEPDPDGLEEA